MTESKKSNVSALSVGSKIRVLALSHRHFLNSLSPAESANIQSMVGEVFEIYEIDDYGSPWIIKWWHTSDGQSYSHSLRLENSEFEIID